MKGMAKVRGIPPSQVVAWAAQQLAGAEGGHFLLVLHDDGCPCNSGDRSLLSCTCEAVDVELSQAWTATPPPSM